MNESKKWEILSLATLGMVGAYFLIKRKFKEPKTYQEQINSQLPTRPDEVLSVADDENISHQMRNTKNTQLDLTRGQSTFVRKLDSGRKRFKVFKICITGGPCAGKTTGIAFVAERLRERGFRVFIVPEAATLIAGGGGMIKTHEYTESDAIVFQTTLLETQIHLEDSFMELAYLAKDEAEDAVVLTDRGLMDGSAYMRPESWQALLDEKGLSEINLRDKRYDAVIHMVTAADGAQEYYNLSNAARYESTLEMAITVDRNIQNAWIGHHSRILIDNRAKTFEEKMQKLFESCCRVVGIPKGKDALYKRYLLKTLNKLPSSLKTQHFYIHDTYIKVDEEHHIIIKIRKRGQNGLFTYTISEINRAEDPSKQNISTKRQLSPREYVTFLQQADPTRQTLEKERFCFTHEGRSYLIDTLKNVMGGFHILRVEVESHQGDPNLPDFLSDLVAREISSEKGYSSMILSKKKWIVPEGDLAYFGVSK